MMHVPKKGKELPYDSEFLTFLFVHSLYQPPNLCLSSSIIY